MDVKRLLGRGWWSGFGSVIAVIFSAFSMYSTSLKQPELRVFVPPVIQYSSPYQNTNFEVFAVPVTITNEGARTGTVLSLELIATDAEGKQAKRFYSGHFGTWSLEKARTFQFKPFAPMSMPGRSSQSDTVLFYPRHDEKVMQLVSAAGAYKFTLKVNLAEVSDFGLVDRWWRREPEPVTFEMTLPVLDHRAFNTGTLAMHQKDWKTSVGGN
jgi:uncharacterized protein affecting Mg2+/Co2+ transport